MFSSHFETGSIKNKYPFVRFGRGEEKLVVFPPINDALFSIPEVAWFVYSLFSPFGKKYEVYVISRKRNLPVGYSTREMAADYADALESIGPAHILGASLGGMIAQHLACDYPGYVKKLILVASAHRMGPEGLKIARRWIPWARLGMWKSIYRDTAELSYNRFYQMGCRLAEPYVLGMCRKIKDPSDFITAGQAGIIHDSMERLGDIRAPVLITGGTDDSFFPEAHFYEMAEVLKEAHLLIFKGGRHGVLEEYRRKCVKVMLEFLAAPQGAIFQAKGDACVRSS